MAAQLGRGLMGGRVEKISNFPTEENSMQTSHEKLNDLKK